MCGVCAPSCTKYKQVKCAECILGAITGNASDLSEYAQAISY